MALLEEKGGPPIPRTGFRSTGVSEAPKRQGEVPLIDNPTAQYTYTPGSSRPGMLNSPNSVSFKDIQNGYLVDSYIRQSSSKYAEKIIREGYRFVGDNQAAVEYIEARLDMMTASTGISWRFPIIQAIREYVKFGNGYLIKARMQKSANIFGMKKKGMRRTATPAGSTKPPVGGYFAASPTSLTPVFDQKTNKLKAWQQASSNGTVEFDLDDVIHLTYDRQPGEIYGTSYLLPVLDDVRSLRQCEEMIMHLVFKSLNPLIHHEVPDTTGTGLGDQADVDRAAQVHKLSAVNGYLCTPPGHKIQVIGVESHALRAEGYLEFIKHRVYAGLGLSDLIMGESSTTSIGASDSFSSIMNDRVIFYQTELGDYLTYGILWELLIEGGFDPIFNPADRVYWRFNEVDVDRRLREEAHWTQLYQGNVLSEDEARTLMGRSALADADRQRMYLNTVQIPLAQTRSQSEATSSSGNSANSTQPTTKTPSKQSYDPTAAFLSRARSAIATSIQNEFSSGRQASVDKTLGAVDSCVKDVSILYGAPDPEVINSVKLAVRASFNSSSSSVTQVMSTLYGWLNSNTCS